MNETTEQVLIWGAAGVAAGLFASRHRGLGILVASVAPAVAAAAHPRKARRVLRAIPKGMVVSGHAIGVSGKVGGEAIWKAARGVGRGWEVAGRTLLRAVS